MDYYLWTFLIGSPELPVPVPWERCIDTRTGFLYYRNFVQHTFVIDLRTRVNLGGNLYYESSAWHDLVGHHYTNYPILAENHLDQDVPFVLVANCQPHTFYLILPEVPQRCLFCGCSLVLDG